MFQFEHPDFFWLLTAVPGIILLSWWYARWRNNALVRFGQTGRLMKERSAVRFWVKVGLLSLSFAFLAFAWANPQWGVRKQMSIQESADVVIVLDISQSMLCRDISPSRLEMARIFAQKLVQSLERERIGLVFFAGSAFLAAPLSMDYTFLIQSLQSAHPDLLTQQGTAITSALELAEKSFDAGSGGGRAVILITDGENHDEEAVETAKKHYDNGIMILAVGAGTPQGGPVPLGDWEGGQYKRDENGEMVRTRLNDEMLRNIAIAGGGAVFSIQQGDRAVAAIARKLNNLEKRAVELRSLDDLESWYQWFLLPVILLLGVEAFLTHWKKT